MLNALRDSAKGITAKIILILLIGSFALWGIGDVFRTNYGGMTVATVGKSVVSVQEYYGALKARQEELRQSLGRAYSPELMKKIGLEEQVLYNLINHRAVEAAAADLGVVISDEALRDAITRLPAFHNEQGMFELAQYQATLRQMGMPEQRFLAQMRADMAARLVTESVNGAASAPDSLVSLLYGLRAEKRVVDIWVITAGNTKLTLPSPKEEEIKAYYQAHKESFMLPQMRSFSYVHIDPAEVAKTITPSAQEVQAAYEERKAELAQPEKRAVKQLLFEEEASAKEAVSRIRNGAGFEAVAASLPVINKDKINLGEISRQGLEDAAADTVFGLKEGEVSAPVQTAFGWHVFKVEHIIAPGALSLEAARPQIEKELKETQASDVTYKLATMMEDALSGGQSLEAAAGASGQKMEKIGPVNERGGKADGSKQPLPGGQELLTAVFSVQEGERATTVQTPSGGYIIARVDSIVPASARALEEVQPEIIRDLKAQKENEALRLVAEAVANEIKSGKAPAEAMAAHQVTPLFASSGTISRMKAVPQAGLFKDKALPAGLVSELFRLPLDNATDAYPMEDGGYGLALVRQIIRAPLEQPGLMPDDKLLTSLRDELAVSRGEDMLSLYLGYLRASYGVKVNDAAVNAATGRAQ